jgi:hypothetical protein
MSGGSSARTSRCALDKFENPIAGIVGGHLLVVERERDPGGDVRMLPVVVRNLFQLVGPEHPDVAALALQCTDEALRAVPPISALPMFQRSFTLLSRAAQERPELVPAALWRRMGAQTSVPPFLAWATDEAPPRGRARPPRPGARVRDRPHRDRRGRRRGAGPARPRRALAPSPSRPRLAASWSSSRSPKRVPLDRALARSGGGARRGRNSWPNSGAAPSRTRAPACCGTSGGRRQPRAGQRRGSTGCAGKTAASTCSRGGRARRGSRATPFDGGAHPARRAGGVHRGDGARGPRPLDPAGVVAP